ncbi:MAG: membrane or secreted protein [Spirosomataceae bacterium]
MKKLRYLFGTIVFILTAAVAAFAQMKGAWKQTTPDGKTTVMICSDNYLMITRYKEKEFLYTEGGTYSFHEGMLAYISEFNSADTSKVGKTMHIKTTISGSKLLTEGLGEWQQIDNASSAAAANYRITGRMGENGSITQMQRGARKTLKLLTDTHFQWAAINPQTKQFSGTGAVLTPSKMENIPKKLSFSAGTITVWELL